MTYALDSNIVSYFLRKNQQIETKIKEIVDKDSDYIIPPMVYYEIKRWLILRDATDKLSVFDYLCRFTKKISMDNDSWEKAIEIYSTLAKKGNLIVMRILLSHHIAL